MGNNYFRFKQFTIYQDACAMKVCTDACIQGAFTAACVPHNARILDIGAGTGLLSLMLAQQLPAVNITGVELDAAAAGQALSNINASPWKDRMQVINSDVRELKGDDTYNFIISNPPFYESDLKSNDQLRNQAMHATTLNYTALLQVIAAHLTPEGRFSILLPYRPFLNFCTLAATAGFYPSQILEVRQRIEQDYFRAVGIFGRKEVAVEKTDMAIRDADNNYTPAFTTLLQPFYLYL